MNASRAYSVVWSRRFSVGRVQTPTLAMVVERDKAIEGHKATKFWRLQLRMGGWTLESEKLDDQVKAQRFASMAMGRPIHVVKVERKRVNGKAPALYDLTGLQKAMGARHGVTAARTLEALQRL